MRIESEWNLTKRLEDRMAVDMEKVSKQKENDNISASAKSPPNLSPTKAKSLFDFIDEEEAQDATEELCNTPQNQ